MFSRPPVPGFDRDQKITGNRWIKFQISGHSWGVVLLTFVYRG